jgi:hypothetical protein
VVLFFKTSKERKTMILTRSILSFFALISVATTTAESTGNDERKLQFGRNDLCRCQAEWEEFYFRSRRLDEVVKVSEKAMGDDEERQPAQRSLQFYDPNDIVFDDILRLFVVEEIYVLNCLDRRHLKASNATNTSQVHQHYERDLGRHHGFASNIFRTGRPQDIGSMNAHPYFGGANYPPRGNTFLGGINGGQPGFMRTSPYYGGADYTSSGQHQQRPGPIGGTNYPPRPYYGGSDYSSGQHQQGPAPMMNNRYIGGTNYLPRPYYGGSDFSSGQHRQGPGGMVNNPYIGDTNYPPRERPLGKRLLPAGHVHEHLAKR